MIKYFAILILIACIGCGGGRLTPKEPAQLEMSTIFSMSKVELKSKLNQIRPGQKIDTLFKIGRTPYSPLFKNVVLYVIQSKDNLKSRVNTAMITWSEPFVFVVCNNSGKIQNIEFHLFVPVTLIKNVKDKFSTSDRIKRGLYNQYDLDIWQHIKFDLTVINNIIVRTDITPHLAVSVNLVEYGDHFSKRINSLYLFTTLDSFLSELSDDDAIKVENIVKPLLLSENNIVRVASITEVKNNFLNGNTEWGLAYFWLKYH
jgi:hypothetical protein